MSAPSMHTEVPALTFAAVWAALVALTGALVAANHYAPGNPGIVATMVITPTKASLVLWFFMHLKGEGWAIRYMVLAALLTISVFIGLLMLGSILSPSES